VSVVGRRSVMRDLAVTLVVGLAACREPAAKQTPPPASPTEPRAIKGVLVRSESGQPAAGVLLLLVHVNYDDKKRRSLSVIPAELKAFGEVNTDANGAFYIRNIPAGTYALTHLVEQSAGRWGLGELELQGVRSLDIVVKENDPVLDLGKITLREKGP